MRGPSLPPEGDPAASEAGLHDYGNNDWAGYTSDLPEALDASTRRHGRGSSLDDSLPGFNDGGDIHYSFAGVSAWSTPVVPCRRDAI